jgi:hypothetical protein
MPFMMPGIWRTGVAAIVLTTVFGVIVASFAEWSGGADSDFATADPRFTETWIIPQIPVGSGDGNQTNYSTVIQVANVDSGSVSVKGHFYVSGRTTLADDALRETSIPAGGSLVITPSESGLVGLNGNWATIEATGSVSVTTLFELRDAAGELLTRLDVPASRPMWKFVIPRIRNAQSDVAFAIANASPVPANISASLRSADGAVIATKILSIAPWAQAAQFVGELFGDVSAGLDTSYSSVTFDGGSTAQLGAIAISYEGPVQTSVPITPLSSKRE